MLSRPATQVGDVCSKGHVISGDNISKRRRSNGSYGIACKTCYNAHNRASRARRREEAGAPGKRKRGVCDFPDCGKPHFGKGFCRAHYAQKYEYQRELRPLGKRSKPSEHRRPPEIEAKQLERAMAKAKTSDAYRESIKIKVGDVCPKGHLIDGENLAWRKRPYGMVPRCRTCEHDAMANLREFKKSIGEPRKDNRKYRDRREYNRNPESPGRISSRRSSFHKTLMRLLAEEEDLAKLDQNRPNSPWVLLKPKPVAQTAFDEFNEALKYEKPNCVSRPDEFMDYAEPTETPEEGQKPFPSRQHAKELCAGCPLFDLCGTYANREQPVWGIHGGIRYIPDPNDKSGYKGKAY